MNRLDKTDRQRMDVVPADLKQLVQKLGESPLGLCIPYYRIRFPHAPKCAEAGRRPSEVLRDGLESPQRIALSTSRASQLRHTTIRSASAESSTSRSLIVTAPRNNCR